MVKRKAASSTGNENEPAAKKSRRGPYFKWLKEGKVPYSTKLSREKPPAPKVRGISVTRCATNQRINASQIKKHGRVAKPLAPISSNSHILRSSVNDNQRIHYESSTLPEGASTGFVEHCHHPPADPNINHENSCVEEGPNMDLEQPFEQHFQDECSPVSSDNFSVRKSPQQETSLIPNDLEELVHDPFYEVARHCDDNKLTENEQFDENFDLESLQEDSSYNSTGRQESHDSNYSSSDDKSSDEEEMLAQAPDLHLSKERKIFLLLLLATKKRHNLSYYAAEDVMELAGVLSPDKTNFVPSRHLMKRAIEMYSAMTMSEHHVCPSCGYYIGIVENTSFKCDKCNQFFDTISNMTNGNMFLYFSLTAQIKSIIRHCLNDIVDTSKRTKICQFNLEDIYDGKVYKNSVESGSLTINCFVDGLQVSTTSKRSAWPVLAAINELPLHLRRKYILMGSLWLALKKPNCQQYLKPFVKECNILARDGVSVKVGKRSLHFCVKTLMCISDTIARPLLRNSTQFNGDHGCGLCYHPGVSMKYKKGTVHSYSSQHGEYPLRTHEETMQYALMAENEGKPVMGIKGKSIFSEIEGFNVCSGLDLDFFHVLVNVAKRFAYLWFIERLKSKPYSLFNKFTEVDSRLLSITPTSDVARAPRSLKDRSDFRGHEWFHWVVEYSIPVLKGMLPARYLNHWGRLVHAVAVLMQNSVSKSDVCYSSRNLKSFVEDIDRLYGPQHVTISVHLLTHLGESVFNFAQPFTHSAFMYESFNHEIKNFVKSSYEVAKQIYKGMQLRIALKNLEEDVKDAMTNEQLNYFQKMTVSGFRSHVEPHLVVGDINFLGKPQNLVLSPQYLAPLQEEGLTVNSLSIFLRCSFQGEVFHASTYKRASRQNNSVVLLDDDSVFCIDYFVVGNSKCYILGKVLPKNNRTKLCDIKLPHIFVLKEPEDLVRCYPISSISSKLLSFKIDILSECVTIACINVLQQEMLRSDCEPLDEICFMKQSTDLDLLPLVSTSPYTIYQSFLRKVNSFRKLLFNTTYYF